MATYNFLNKSTGDTQSIEAESGQDAVNQYQASNGFEGAEANYSSPDAGSLNANGTSVSFSKGDDGDSEPNAVQTGAKMAGDFANTVARTM